MKCLKCQTEYDDDYNYCPWCGCKKGSPAPRKRVKRANGTGTVYKLSGRRRKPWVASMSKLVDNKQEHIIVGYYAKRAEAEAALGERLNKPLSEMFNITFSEAYALWSKEHFPTIGAKGIEGYRGAWEYLAPLREFKVRSVRTADFQEVINGMMTIGRSYSLCGKVRQLCSQLCKYAMRENIIDRNYAEYIHMPKNEKKEKAIFSGEDIKKLWAQKDDAVCSIILILIYTGFRINELFTLKRSDIHIDKNYMVGGEKTEAGKNRVVPINEKIRPLIQAWIDKKPAKGSASEYLIFNASGGKKDPKNFRDREFYPTLIRLGIIPEFRKGEIGADGEVIKESPKPSLTPHSTRHTFASLMAAAGVKPEVLQKIIGHADYSTTAEIYIHSDLEQLKNAIAQI